MGELLQRELLDHMIPEDALTADIAALGGAYKVGKKLRPELDQKAARDWLLNCLNPNHKQNLTQAQIMLIVQWGRAVGATNYIEFWPTNNSMTKPVKIEPEDEKVRLKREVVKAADTFKQLVERLERLNQ
jgi:hypothetical protein